MRSILCTSSLAILLLALGCNHIVPHQRDKGGDGIVKDQPAAPPTVEALVAYLNANAQRVPPGQALNCTNVTIDINAEGQGQVGIMGMMQCQAPRNFMLSGMALGKPVVEVGSNDKEFWFWSSQINPPYLYHCSYDKLAQGVKVPFPFQPDMVLSALGLSAYDATKQYSMQFTPPDNRGRKFIELTERGLSPENKPIQKITVFNAGAVTVPNPQVVAHILKDEKGNVICSASIRSAQRVGGDNGPIIPQMVDFNWPEQKMKMTMRIYGPKFRAMPPETAAQIFNRQKLQWQPFDLATQPLDGSVQQAGATGTTYRR
jgi:hypothetical protein